MPGHSEFVTFPAAYADRVRTGYTERAIELSSVAGVPQGLLLGGFTDDKVGFHGAVPVIQRVGAAQAAITDSTTGTASATTAAAGTGVQTVAIPLQLASMTTSAADLMTEYVPGYRFKVLSVEFVTTTVGTGTSASQVINLEIETTNVTGGVLTLLLADTDTLGKKTAATAVTAANVGTAAQKLSIEVAASGTVFTAGAGVLLVKLQNMDTADTASTIIQRVNELRAALVEKGLISGAA